jgi:hypothetical protein
MIEAEKTLSGVVFCESVSTERFSGNLQINEFWIKFKPQTALKISEQF